MEYFYINFFLCYLKIKINPNKAKLLSIIFYLDSKNYIYYFYKKIDGAIYPNSSNNN